MNWATSSDGSAHRGNPLEIREVGMPYPVASAVDAGENKVLVAADMNSAR